MAAAECIGHNVACRRHGGVKHTHAHASLHQPAGQNVGSIFRVAVDRCISQANALFFGCVAAPQEIFLQELTEAFSPHRSVKRAYRVQLQLGSLFQHCLNLRSVFAHNVGVIPSGLIQLFAEKVSLIGKQAAVESAECAEGICREQQLVCYVIGHHHFRPVHHRCHHKGEAVFARREGVPLFHNLDSARQVHVKKLAQHGLDLAVAYDRHVRIAGQQSLNGIGVVRLHVVNNQIVQLSAVQGILHILKECLIYCFIHGVKQHRFLILQQIGVIGYAVRNAVNTLKAGKPAVVRPYPGQVLGYFSCKMHDDKPPLS